MVRMSQMMTLACATILVAGTAANAADKVTVAPSKGLVSAQPTGQSLRARLPGLNYTPSANGNVSEDCTCTWENGDVNLQDLNGEASHEGGAFQDGVKVADDFYLCDGFVYDLHRISAEVITDSLTDLTKARLELYSDCNGCPGELLYTFTEFRKSEGDSVGDGFRRVIYTFDVADQNDDDENNIVLKGGTYWVSVVGLSDNRCATMPMCDSTFWLAAEGPVKGSVPKKIFGVPGTGRIGSYNYSGQEWIPFDECCIGCVDLSFVVCATPCKILIDNGDALAQGGVLGNRSERSASNTRNSRAADDFVVNPCHDLAVCYIEGCVYTNCIGFEGWFDIFGNDCKEPSYVLGTPAPWSGQATKIVDLYFDVVIDNKSLHAYRLEFHDLDFVLPRGRQYWISLNVKDTFSIQERAYFCSNYYCDDRCPIRFNPGHVIGTPNGSASEWVSVDHDFSFLIAGDDADRDDANSTPTCAADFNNDGQATVQDLFDFLNGWFAGCP